MSLNNVFTTASTIGSARVFDLHPQQNLIAYDAGFHVVLLDLQTSKKLTVHSHNNTISCIQFVGTNSEYILSIDSQSIPCLLLTHWPSQTFVQQHYLSTTIKDSPVLKVKCAYSSQNFLVIAENFKEKYVLSLWDFKSDSVSLLASHTEDVLSQCSSINIFEAQRGKYSLFFAVTEKKTIKYWGYNRQKLELVNKIHVKDNIVDSVISPLTQFLLFITEPGKLCIVDKEGQYVSSVSHPMLVYSCLSLYNDYLFLGTVQGDVEIYQLSSLKFTKSLKNLRQLPKKTLSASVNPKADLYSQAMSTPIEQQGALEPSKKLVKLGITGSHRVLALMYEDLQIFFYDFEKGKQVGSITGHSEKIKEIVWDPNSEQTMISCSHDGTLRVWNFTGDGWTSSPIYAGTTSGFARLNEKAREIMPKTTKGDISFRSHKSIDYRFTCMQVLWEENQIYAGDNRGCLCVYDLQTRSLLQEIQIAHSKIKRIALGDNNNFIGVVLADGSSFVVDRRANLGTKIQLERDSIEAGGKASFFRGIKLLEEEIPTAFLRSQSKLTKTSSVSLLKPNLQSTDFAATNRTQGLSQMGDHSHKGGLAQLRVVTTCNANTLRLHQISKSQQSLSSLIIANYSVNGKILDFDVHSSKEFLIVLSNQGLLSIFKLGSGELRVRIEVAELSQKMALDPSGLYIAVTLPCIPDNKDLTTFKRSGKWIPPERTFSFNRENEVIEGGVNTDQNAIILYEIWTGEMIGETKKIQTISCLQFSEEGKRLAVGSLNGQVAVLEVDRSIQANMKGVLEEVKQDPLFWSNFYIEANEPQHHHQAQDYRDHREYRDRDRDSEIEDDRQSAYRDDKSFRAPSQHQEDLSVRARLSEKFKEAATSPNTPSQRSVALTNKEVQVTHGTQRGATSQVSLPGSYRDQPYSAGQDRINREYLQDNQIKLMSTALSEPVNNRGSQHSQRTSVVSIHSQGQVEPNNVHRSIGNIGKPSSTASPNFKSESQNFDRQEYRYNRYPENKEKQVPHVMQGTQYSRQALGSEKGVGSMNINDPFSYGEIDRVRPPISSHANISQGKMNVRKIESDPSDIDDNIETPGRASMFNYDNYREGGETTGFNPVSDYQSRYGYSDFGPAAKNYPWHKDTQLTMKEQESEDASGVYNDIDEFQKRFLRESASSYK